MMWRMEDWNSSTIILCREGVIYYQASSEEDSRASEDLKTIQIHCYPLPHFRVESRLLNHQISLHSPRNSEGWKLTLWGNSLF
mmetsp:Transcript_17355/g.41534  ORF Transcript_17355/g.41534 Transcript_17355/m.41534 type:complete len:83 (-) Transcript_17355:1038-1286(-)